MDLDKEDYENSLKFIMDKRMASQEEHCSCVPTLKRRIEELELKLKEFEGKDFWTNWVYPDGAKPEEIQNELLDYYTFMEDVALVYDRITNGRISKPNTSAVAVISEFEELYRPIDGDDEDEI